MADPASLTLGILGVAGLFSVCVQCFDMVQMGRSRNRDFEILHTKLDVQKVRFLIWGEAVGLVGSVATSEDLNLLDIRPTVEKVLKCIHLLFTDSEKLTSRYGILKEGNIFKAVTSTGNQGSVFKRTFARFHRQISLRTHEISISRSARWVIDDEKKFRSLVQDLRDLIDDLEGLTKSAQFFQRQREIVTYEIESISDTPSLELLHDASIGEDQEISDVASGRLSLARNESVGLPSVLSSIINSLSINETFYTAPSCHEARETFDDFDAPEAGGASISAIPQNMRIMKEYACQDLKRGTTDAVSIVTQDVGQRIKHIKLVDEEYTKYVCRTFPSGSAHRSRRVIRELQTFGERYSTTYCSLRPIGNDIFHLLGSFEGPPGSPYEGGIFYISIDIADDYPLQAPKFQFLTKIYHPNIDARGKICLDVLESRWSPSQILGTSLLSIQSLLCDPNLEDPLVPEIAATFIKDFDTYNTNARSYTIKYAQAGPPNIPGVMQTMSDLPSLLEASHTQK